MSKIMKDVVTIAFLLMQKQYYQISYQLTKNLIVQIMSYFKTYMEKIPRQ